MKEVLNWTVELDMDDGSLWDDFERSQSYRAETMDYVRLCLGLSDSRNDSKVHLVPKIICNFEVIGKAIRDAYSRGW